VVVVALRPGEVVLLGGGGDAARRRWRLPLMLLRPAVQGPPILAPRRLAGRAPEAARGARACMLVLSRAAPRERRWRKKGGEAETRNVSLPDSARAH
jgi:hypothetical protein